MASANRNSRFSLPMALLNSLIQLIGHADRGGALIGRTRRPIIYNERATRLQL
jgi:hypothetical protein